MAVRRKLDLELAQFLQPAASETLPSSRVYTARKKQAGQTLIPHSSSLVDTSCRVPVREDTLRIQAAQERSRLFARAGNSFAEKPDLL